MSTLEDLAIREMSLLDHANRTVGLMEEKFRQLREAGVFAESAAVHAAYVDLASPPTSSLEALKRAIFMGWYECAEPGCFTGIGYLSRDMQCRAQTLLDSAYDAGLVDAEFAVMLGWYWLIADYHFKYQATARVVRYLRKLDPQAYTRFNFTRAALEGRGQMGNYWISLACRNG